MIHQLTTSKTLRGGRLLAIPAITLFALLLSLLLAATPPAARLNDFFYDIFYRARPITPDQTSDVILITADEASIAAIKQRYKRGWPWQREFWGAIATYAANSGARAIVSDILFQDPSVYQDVSGDDDTFASQIAAIQSKKIPVIFGSGAQPNGSWEDFGPPIKSPTLGAVNVGDDKVYRSYQPTVNGKPSLAAATLNALHLPEKLPPNENPDAPFRLHYYGPRFTFQFLPAWAVFSAQIDGPEKAKLAHISPDLFTNKIVILCGTARGTFDLKTSPLSDEYPGPEVHATAIENLLRGQRAETLSTFSIALLSFLAAAIATTGIIIPRQAWAKLLPPAFCLLLLFTLAVALFRGNSIQFLPPVAPLLSILLATPLAFAFTYFAEDRQRRFMLKALSKVVSPAVAEQLARNPERLARGTLRTELTLVFTDLANFTDLAEGMDVQHLGAFMNRYLGEMSDQVLHQDGTLDKYIGDAVMAFWNAPLPQSDHAARACRAALLMLALEQRLHDEFAAGSSKKDAQRLFTRIGINTATVAVGFIGSDHLFNYTALGDGVNLASRLEGANKIYGTRILISENTATLVRNQFFLRKIDILRVKGKKEPMPVYELLATRPSSPPLHDNPAFQNLITQYEQALAAYQSQNWNLAQQLLLTLQNSHPNDGPAATLLARIQSFQKNPPSQTWDGIHDSTTK